MASISTTRLCRSGRQLQNCSKNPGKRMCGELKSRSQRVFHFHQHKGTTIKKNTKVLLLTCGRMICEAAFSRTGTSTNTNSKHSPSTTQTLTCLPWQGGQKLMTIIYPISDKVVNCNHLNGQPQQYLSICLSSSENYISTKFHYTACIMLLLVTTCEGS